MNDIDDVLDGVTSDNARYITVLEWREKTRVRLAPRFHKEAATYIGTSHNPYQLTRAALTDSILNNPLADDETVLTDARTYVGCEI